MTYLRPTKPLRVSIVLPVYNEADHIAACLHAIYRQTWAPFEVIVVDNNSTDATAAIAASFPFVRLLHEPKQGVVHARNRGFDAARGDVIGRIDADTRVPENWVATVQQIFADRDIDAVSGSVTYHDIAWAPVVNAIDLQVRRGYAWVLARTVPLQGCNMALRRSAWRRARRAVCNEAGMHEDFDLAIHLARTGSVVRFDERLKAAVGFRQTEGGWHEFANYVLLTPRTYLRHRVPRARSIYVVAAFLLGVYVPLRVLHHGYDTRRGKFTLRMLLTAVVAHRVNPATFVD